MKLLYDLEKERVNNKRIQTYLNSLNCAGKRNIYCKKIIEKKRILLKLRKQCIKLKLKFKYGIDYTLKNLDLIKLKALQKNLKANETY